MQPSAYSLREYIAHYVSKGWMRAAPELCVMGGWIHRFEGGGRIEKLDATRVYLVKRYTSSRAY